ncbi:MAG: hypothetical protein JNL33_10275 [Betaproteobacteria bacterium]|nr:hypothetical protein [Betaproteobacteria bacterium]
MTSGAVKGSLVLDADGKGLSFVRTGGALAADSYTLTVRAGAGGLRDASGNVLDGNADGTVGDDYIAAFRVPTAPAVTLSLPDVMRGPGQDVVVPNNIAGGLHLPVRVSEGQGVESIAFTLLFDAAMLEVQDVRLATGFAGTVSRTAVAGGIRVQAQFDAPLPAGAVSPIDIVSRVPAGATYGAAQVLDLRDVVVAGDGGDPVEAMGEDALHVAAYLMDADANRSYGNADLTLLQNVAQGVDSGFAAYRGIDPSIVGDLNGNGQITTLDSNRFMQFLAGQARPEIPALPAAAVAQPAVVPLVTPPAGSNVNWNETWNPGTSGTTPTVPPTTPSTTPAWKDTAWAKDLTQRLDQLGSGSTGTGGGSLLKNLSRLLAKL